MQIVRTRAFAKSLKKLAASEADIAALEDEIATNPEAGAVIPGRLAWCTQDSLRNEG